MGRKNSPASFKALILALALAGTGFMGSSQTARANDLPLAAGSPLVGFNFDDRPLLLPVQRNFQMAMLTAGSELGRSCGKMEAYGWRMNQAEQQRVNQIFNNTVDRLRGIGYGIEAAVPASVSRDITIFTADRADKHFLFMWSAGEIGLVMTLCETSAPATKMPPISTWASPQPMSQDVVQSKLDTPKPSLMPTARRTENFSPVGSWVGSYLCAQGYTGATLSITSLKGDNFEGNFRFYPTEKNPYVPQGRYTIYGQYDRDSQRILINPGKWLERPKDYYNTVMVGGFDPVHGTFSAYFQGITGCTSFEAKYQGNVTDSLASKKSATKKKKHKKKIAKPVKKPIVTQTETPAASSTVTGTSTPPAVSTPTAQQAPMETAPEPSAAKPPAIVPPATQPSVSGQAEQPSSAAPPKSEPVAPTAAAPTVTPETATPSPAPTAVVAPVPPAATVPAINLPTPAPTVAPAPAKRTTSFEPLPPSAAAAPAVPPAPGAPGVGASSGVPAAPVAPTAPGSIPTDQPAAIALPASGVPGPAGVGR